MAGRFSLSFPSRRDRDDPWFRIGTLDVTTTAFVSIVVGISMFVWAADRTALLSLALLPDEVRSGQVWRVLTWPVYNEPTIWTVIGIAIFWMFGHQLERQVGRVRFAWFLGVLVVGAGLVGTLLDLPQGGFRSVQFAVLLVYIAEYPFVRFFFNIPGWVLGVVFVGLEVLQLLGLRDGKGLAFLVVMLTIAALSARTFGMLAEYAWLPRLGRSRSSRARPVRGRRTRSAAPVVSGPWSSAADSAAAAEQAELDGLLDKISASGIDSLSKAEKQRLNELSKRLRDR